MATSPTHAGDFVARTRQWALNADAPATMRNGLCGHSRRTTLIDGTRFARGFEQTISALG